MNQVKVYSILQEQGFSKENAQSLITAFLENNENATRSDLYRVRDELRSDINRLEVKMHEGFTKIHEQMNHQTKWFIGSIAVIATLLKITDLIIHRL